MYFDRSNQYHVRVCKIVSSCEEPEVLVGLGVEQVAGLLALLRYAHAQALAVLDQELRRAIVAPARSASAPQPTHACSQE